MFQRIEQADGLVFYQSTLLTREGVLHGFSSRQVSHDQDWDLTDLHSDPPSQPSSGYIRLQQVVGCANYPLVHVNQVHGSHVMLVDDQDALQTLEANSSTSIITPPAEADGLVTAHPGVALTIRVADCVPILLAGFIAGQVHTVAAVHAGWRGLIAGVIPKAVRTLHQQASSLAPDQELRIIAAIGPCISARHFEVGPEVAAAFIDANLDAAVLSAPEVSAEPTGKSSGGGRPHVDLPLAAKLQLQAAGLDQNDIDLGQLCTYGCEKDFYSYRRDQGHTGRLAAMIAMQKP